MENYFWSEEFAFCNQTPNEDATYFVPQLPATTSLPNYYPVAGAYDEEAENGGAASASRSHSEAEKRRRDKINARLTTLRKLVPKSEKMDKAALLGHVVEHVKELSAKAKEHGDFSNIPSEIDEVTIDHINEGSQNDQNVFIKASICCDDRPELYAELNNALRELGLTIVHGDLTTLGGRTKIIFVLRCAVQNSSHTVSSFKQTLKMVLSRVAFWSVTSSFCARSKRQRFFYQDS